MNTSLRRVLSWALLSLCVGAGLPALALPTLPGNEHSHTANDVPWYDGGSPGGALANSNTVAHQHYNALPLGANNGEASFFANKAWDNNGTTTTFHSCLGGIGSANCDTRAFGHGYVQNRVLYYFDPAQPAPDASFHDRVVGGFSDWTTGANARFNAVGKKNINNVPLTLGFSFEEAVKKPATELFINVQFLDLGNPAVGNNPTGLFDSGTLTLQFNTNANITWYTGAAAPTAGDKKQDFLTTARHEVGHAVGFGHNKDASKTAASSIMWSGAAPLDTRVSIKQGDFDGVLALYTQPVPEPATWIMASIGLMMIFISLHRRRQRS